MWVPNEVEAWAKATTHPSQSLALGAMHPTGELPARLPQGCDSRRAGGRRLWRDNQASFTHTSLASHFGLPGTHDAVR